MGWFRRGNPMDPHELERVKAEVRSLRDAIAAADERRRHERQQAAAFPPPSPSPVPSPAEVASDAQARLDELAARLDELISQNSSSSDPRLEELASKLSDLDQRVTAVSTELANQVSELGNDIDALATHPPGDGPDETVIEELRDGQARLANEQARYQIAFREDLARLAEQLRRPSA